jgi:3-oxoadipate enol-lactonase
VYQLAPMYYSRKHSGSGPWLNLAVVSRSNDGEVMIVEPGPEGSSRVRGVNLSWSAAGEGPLVLFAHGLGNDRWTLERVGLLDWSAIPVAGRRLVRFDARGHGTSTARVDPPDPEQFTWAELARDLLELAADISGTRAPIDAIGASMGTGTLLHAAVQAPDRFRRLVLSAAPTAWHTRSAQAGMYEEAARLVEREGLRVFESMLAQRALPPVFAHLTRYPSQLAVTRALMPAVLRGAALSDLPSLAELATLAMPILLLAWEGDPVHPVATAEQLANILPDARLHVARTPEELQTWGGIAVEFLNE